MRTSWLSHARLLPAVVGICLFGTGCSVWVSAGTSPAPSGPTSSAVAPGGEPLSAADLPRLLGPAPTTSPASLPANASAQERAFVQGVNNFCRGYYVAQKAADTRYPYRPQLARWARMMLERDKPLVTRLTRLSPPAAQATAFQAFATFEQWALNDLKMETSADPQTREQGRDELLDGIDSRHANSHALGASECDGQLPPGQAVAAERAAQRFDLTTDIHQGCGSLVTADFARLAFANRGGDPHATCRRMFRIHRLGTLPVPDNIRVLSVTGVEDFSATVNFVEVPDCGCGGFSARLYYEQGRWLVANVTNG